MTGARLPRSPSPRRWSRWPRPIRRIVAVVNDSVGSSNLKEFKRRFPDRLVNVGIAEQNLVGVSAGLASAGKIPFTCGASCFLTGRALEQIKADLAYSRHNVKLCGMSSGMAYGELGPTHHSIEDLAWTRAIANLTVIVPADPIETAQAVRAAAAIDGPVFLRVSRMPVPTVHADGYAVRRSAGRSRCAPAATSRSSPPASWSARALDGRRRCCEADGIDAAVINMSTIRPIDRDAIARGGAPRPDRHGRGAHGVRRAGRRGRGSGRDDAPGADAHARRPRRVRADRLAPSSCSTTSASTPERHPRRGPRRCVQRAELHGRPHILAIDQGTTNTKVAARSTTPAAIVARASRPVDDRVSAAGLGRAGRRSPSGAASRTPSTSVSRAAGRGDRAPSPSPTSASPSLVWDRATGTPARPVHRLAVPAHGAVLRDAARARPAAASSRRRPG